MQTTPSFLARVSPSLLLAACLGGSSTSSTTDTGSAGTLGTAGTEQGTGLCETPHTLLSRLQGQSAEQKLEFEASYDCTVLRSARFAVKAESDDPLEAAQRFLDAWSGLLPLGEAPSKQLSVYRVVKDEDIDGWHVFLRATRDTVAAEGSTLRVDLAGGLVVGLDVSAGLAPLPEATPKVAADEVALRLRVALESSADADWWLSGEPRLFFHTPQGGAPRLVWGMAASRVEDGQHTAEGEAILDALTGALVAFRPLEVVDASPDLEILDGGGTSGPCFWWWWTDGICDESSCDSNAGQEARDLRSTMRGWHSARRAWDGKDGWDGGNGQMEAVVYIDDYSNASYVSACDQTRYGHGWSVLDVVGHEHQHAVDAHTADLDYEGQSGALDEHLADLQGEALELYQNGTVDWLVGVGLPGNRAGGIRNLKDPSRFGDPTHMQGFLECDAAACGDEDDWDSIEVHTNSGIPNHVLYLVAEGGQHVDGSPTIKGIGLADTITISRRVHQRWLHSDSDFGAYRGATLNFLAQSERVSGVSTAAERCAVMNAWAGAGIGSFDQDCDGLIDAQDADRDGDGFTNDVDLCPSVADPAQGDLDHDGIGDACDDDVDGDRIPNEDDTCPEVAEPTNRDSDGNKIGDACQDQDSDGIIDLWDSCPADANADQADLDSDNIGDVCDSDLDGDGVANTRDNCPTVWGSDQTDADRDGIGDICEDDDNDGVINRSDNCRYVYNPDQADMNRDREGDACDADIDADGLLNEEDACPRAPSESYGKAHLDRDEDGTADACDACPDDAGIGAFQPCLADADGDGKPDLRADWSWSDLRVPVDVTAIMTLAEVLSYPHLSALPGRIPLPVCGEDCPDWREDSEQLSLQTTAGVAHTTLVLDAQGKVVARRHAEKSDAGYTAALSIAPGSGALPPGEGGFVQDGQLFLLVIPDPAALETERPGAQAAYSLTLE